MSKSPFCLFIYFRPENLIINFIRSASECPCDRSSVPEVLTKSPIRSHGSIRLLSLTGSCWFANASIKLFCMHMLVDTGAAVSLISKKVLDNLDL